MLESANPCVNIPILGLDHIPQTIPYWLTTLKYRFFENIPDKDYRKLAAELRSTKIENANFDKIKDSFANCLLDSTRSLTATQQHPVLLNELTQNITSTNLAIALDIAINIHQVTNRLTDRAAKYKEYCKKLVDIIKQA